MLKNIISKHAITAHEKVVFFYVMKIKKFYSKQQQFVKHNKENIKVSFDFTFYYYYFGRRQTIDFVWGVYFSLSIWYCLWLFQLQPSIKILNKIPMEV